MIIEIIENQYSKVLLSTKNWGKYQNAQTKKINARCYN